jgi:hypothetical protein
MITPSASGLCRLDTVTKTKTAQLVQQSCEIGAEERRYIETIYPMVQEATRDGIYRPRRASPLSQILQLLARMRAGVRRESIGMKRG